MYKCSSSTLSIKIHFSKILHISNERMIFKCLLGMGSDMFVKVWIDPNKIYSYKTKFIMEQLDVQNSFNFGWRECSTGRVGCKRMMKCPLVKATDIHFCSMGSDRIYTSILIGVLHHVYHIYLFSPSSCGMKFPSKVCPFSYGNIFLPKDVPFILWR